MDTSPFARQSTLREHMNNIKQQISDLTKELENKVSSGYFDILCSAQNLADLSSRLTDLPNLFAPTPPEVKISFSFASNVARSPYESIWTLIESKKLHEAIKKLLEFESSDETLEIVDYILQHFKQDLPEANADLTEEIMQTLNLISDAISHQKLVSGSLAFSLLKGENAAVKFYFDSLKTKFDSVPEDAREIAECLHEYQQAKDNYDSTVKKFCTSEPLNFDDCLDESKRLMLTAAIDLLHSSSTPHTVLTLYTIKQTSLWDDFRDKWLEKGSSMVISALDSIEWLSATKAELIATALEQSWNGVSPLLSLLSIECPDTHNKCLAELKQKLHADLASLSLSASSDNLLSWYVGVSSQPAFTNDYSFISQLWIQSTSGKNFMEVLRQIRRVCGSLTCFSPEGLGLEVTEAQHVFAKVLKVSNSKPAVRMELEEAPLIGPAEELALTARFNQHLVLS
mmetsp:Transcript_32946/g.57747  ORF Transcript_32946/g.57747 Transcript_32946/m.57747 type:complete len:456 (+) Transcript_32946:507-1874(+)